MLPHALTGIVESVEGLSNLQTMYPDVARPTRARSPAYVAGPVVASGPQAVANGSLRSSAPLRPAGGATPNITNGAYDPTDIYSSEAYDYNALYRQGHCCNPLGNTGSSPPQTSIAIATFGSQQISDMQGFQKPVPLPRLQRPGGVHRRHASML